MSARHRHHKQKIVAAAQAIAACEADLAAYARVIDDMTGQGLPPQTRAPLVIACRAVTERTHERLRTVVEDLKRSVPP